jgi:hypothetical protein
MQTKLRHLHQQLFAIGFSRRPYGNLVQIYNHNSSSRDVDFLKETWVLQAKWKQTAVLTTQKIIVL